MIVVFRYLHPDRRVEHSCPMIWMGDREEGHIPTDLALKFQRRKYGNENVQVEIYHPHIHDQSYFLED